MTLGQRGGLLDLLGEDDARGSPITDTCPAPDGAMAQAMLSIRSANENDIDEIERMVADFVKGHPAELHPRSSKVLRDALLR